MAPQPNLGQVPPFGDLAQIAAHITVVLSNAYKRIGSSSHFVILLSGSISAVAKKDRYIPSRRTGKVPLGAKVFSYYTQDERRLVERAAKLEHRSLSSFVAIAAVERAQRVLGRK